MSLTNLHVTKHSIQGQHVREYARDVATPGRDSSIQIKQYTPKARQDPQASGITVIAAGGLGFIKEVYEPLFEDLVARSEQDGFQIKHIWIADMSVVGGSAIENQDNLGNDPSWWDLSRDLLHMVNHFRDQITQPIMGLGHSMGGAQLAHLSVLHPSLFASLAMIEPQIHPGVDRAGIIFMVKALGRRKETWPSRSAAEKELRKSPFYAAWNPRAIAKLVEHSLVPAKPDSDQVRTTTPKHMEVSLTVRPNFGKAGVSRRIEDLTADDRERVPDIDPSANDIYPFYRPESTAMFKALPSLRPSILYVAGDSSPGFTLELQEAWIQRTGVGIGGSGGAKAGRVKLQTVKGGAHTMPMDASMDKVVEAVGAWFGTEARAWRNKDAEFRRSWDSKSKQEKQQVDPLTVDLIHNYKGKEPLEEFIEKRSKL